MRKQEMKLPKNKRESRQEFLSRLRQTAMRLSRRTINKAIGDMRRRCQRLYAAAATSKRAGAAARTEGREAAPLRPAGEPGLHHA